MARALIAEHSYFWIGIEREQRADGATVARGEQMYVEYFVPPEVRHEHPIVFVHGGGGQGIAFLGLGEGRPGWLHHALAAGHTVYIVDRPGFGRNPPTPELVGPPAEPTPYEAMTPLFGVGAAGGRWPGSGEVGDPAVDAFMAQLRPMRFDTAAHALTSDDPRFAVLNADAIEYLRRGGCGVEDLRLSSHGIRGNGHMMLLEENNGEVLALILQWVAGLGV